MYRVCFLKGGNEPILLNIKVQSDQEAQKQFMRLYHNQLARHDITMGFLVAPGGRIVRTVSSVNYCEV